MKKQTLIYALLLALVSTFSGCAVVGGIFKTGMEVGIFITVLVIVLIIFLAFRFFKKKN